MAARIALALLVALPWALAPSAAAEDAAPAGEAPTPEVEAPSSGSVPSGLGIDSLLRPRGSFSPAPAPALQPRGGRTREEWLDAFAEAREQVSDLEGQVAASQRQIREASKGEWGYSPTGGGAPPTDPEVLKLRAQLKRDRQSLDAARARLRDLDVEASLAGVPDSWRDPMPAP